MAIHHSTSRAETAMTQKEEEEVDCANQTHKKFGMRSCSHFEHIIRKLASRIQKVADPCSR